MSEKRFTLICGPCVIEGENFIMDVAAQLKEQLEGLPIDFYFKASFDKANRSTYSGFRGESMDEGLKILGRVKSELGLKILTDFHASEQAMEVASVVDFLQIPAFLCRQTDMILAGVEAADKYKTKLNVKKGQFLAPWDAVGIVEKARRAQLEISGKKREDEWLYLTERGTCFGYNRLVVDMISFQTMKSFGVPIVYDATHSIQVPGGASGGATGGERQYLENLARAAIAAGASALFMEAHPCPEKAKSDGPNSLPLEKTRQLVEQLLSIHKLVSELPPLLDETPRL